LRLDVTLLWHSKFFWKKICCRNFELYNYKKYEKKIKD